VYHQVASKEGPWSAHVLEIDLPAAWKNGIRLRTWRADPTKKGLGRVSQIASAPNTLAAINGDFFLGQDRIRPSGMQINQGRLLHPPNTLSALVLSTTGKPLIDIFRFKAALFTAAGHALPITAFNRAAADSGLALYTPYAQAMQDTIYAAQGYVLQKLEDASVLNDTIAARVVQVRRRAMPFRLQANQWLVTASSDSPDTAAIAPGDTVHLSCLLPPSTLPLSEAISGGPRILRDGQISVEYQQEHLSRAFAEDRHPRTAVGYSRDGTSLFLVTVDGRQPGFSIGMTLEELGHFMRYELSAFTHSRTNAYQALNLDGGGSTIMVVDKQVVNRPSYLTGERPVANALLVVDTSSPSSP